MLIFKFTHQLNWTKYVIFFTCNNTLLIFNSKWKKKLRLQQLLVQKIILAGWVQISAVFTSNDLEKGMSKISASMHG